MKSDEVKCGHLFLAILEEDDSTGCQLLREEGADLKALARKTRERLEKEPARSIAGPAKADAKKDEKPGTPFLDRFGRDLTAAAREQKVGPIIGRRREILQVIQTLARRTKSNPVLVGEAGVGKTAVAEAVAIRAAAGKDPQVLGGKRSSFSTACAGWARSWVWRTHSNGLCSAFAAIFDELLAGRVGSC